MSKRDEFFWGSLLLSAVLWFITLLSTKWPANLVATSFLGMLATINTAIFAFLLGERLLRGKPRLRKIAAGGAWLASVFVTLVGWFRGNTLEVGVALIFMICLVAFGAGLFDSESEKAPVV
ncbi:hypothetical protein EPN83_00545 [Patescibacteria group bacterium]|nr:MAG: hypothetical protein EPN83_00545 [Patescibacteria group bacterium]